MIMDEEESTSQAEIPNPKKKRGRPKKTKTISQECQKAIKKLYSTPIYLPYVKRAIHFLQPKSKKKSSRYSEKELTEPTYNCRTAMAFRRNDSQVQLHARQLRSVITELRKSILRHDWNEAARLLMVLCHPGLKPYSGIILKTSVILLFNHQNSNSHLIQNFVKKVTSYVLDEDVSKFIRILFTLPSAEKVSKINNCTKRTTYDSKITFQPEFEKL